MFSRGTFISSLCNCKENDRTNICTFKTAVAKTIDMNKNKHDINANINEKKDPKRNKPYGKYSLNYI